ncbi:sensor histidine kinase [Sandaracinus amylolyticus]|uniref:sensor histidine kinase n=1 Tax=Sandaracinus amylolyticus TaxID=927083 RepID=UPI001F34BC8D|nr:HAMP domain-containing sensor histidine kinase [Sandaracinus amylolyticus]UJR83442.1 Hypothetical protein I5071_55100 [Sandaracinus amylolyticus]
MQIATRLWLTLLVTMSTVLVVGVMLRVQEEQRLLLEVTLRDRRFFAHALHAAITRDRSGADPLDEARRMLDREEVAAAHIVARLVSLESRSHLRSPALPAREIAPLLRGEVVVGVHGGEVLTYIPLDTTGGVAIELAEPQAVNELLERIGWWSLFTQALTLAMLEALVTWGLVRWLVGRPLERLALLARRIGSGDLDARSELATKPGDVGVLAGEMNHMAERLQHARKHIEEADTERVAALEQLRHADRLRTVGQLASALAHELGTPLNVVSGHARIIEQDDRVPDDARASARTVLEQASRMARIIRDLLDFARRRGGQPAPHVVAEIARHAADTLAPLARRQRAIIDVEARTPDTKVRVDAQQILQVLTNLITNALQAMPEGGPVRIVVEQREVVPPTGVHAKGGRYASIAVIDTGTGIAPEDLPHLFEPFFTRKGEGEGTGIGLPVVEGIVREHGGWVAVESEPGRGSKFEVFLPLHEP